MIFSKKIISKNLKKRALGWMSCWSLFLTLSCGYVDFKVGLKMGVLLHSQNHFAREGKLDLNISIKKTSRVSKKSYYGLEERFF